MFITRESDYAMRVIRALMWEPRLSVSEICERESITAPFAYKILKKLQNAGLVEGYRGVHGGYALKRDPEELSLYEIYSAIDPDMSIIECLNGTYQCPRNGQDGVPCHAHDELDPGSAVDNAPSEIHEGSFRKRGEVIPGCELG